jgi:hypothetical protein
LANISNFQNLLKSIDVNDIVEIRFAENRQTGQSRGFVTVWTSSEASIKTIFDKAPGRQLNGNPLLVLPFNKHSLARLEDGSKGSSTPSVCLVQNCQ